MKKFALNILQLLLTMSLFAQTEKQLTVSEIRQQTVLTEPLTMQKGYSRITTGMSYFFMSSNYFDNDWKSKSVYSFLSRDFSFPFFIYYGFTNNLELDVSTSVEYNNSTYKIDMIDYYGNMSKTNTYKTITKGFSDIGCNLLYKFLDETPGHLSMAFSTNFSIPYGKMTPTISSDSLIEYDATTMGEYKLGGEYMFKKIFYPYAVVGDFSYTYRFPTDIKLSYSDAEKTHVKYGNYVDINLSFHYMLCDWITLRNYFEYTLSGKPRYYDNNLSYLEISTQEIKWQPTLIFQIKNVRLAQALSFMLFGKNTTTQPSFIVALGIKI
jgi:hypothetical protein